MQYVCPYKSVLYGLLFISVFSCTHQIFSVKGHVTDASGKGIESAIVRVPADSNLVFTDSNGRFLLQDVKWSKDLHITAWKAGHYIAGEPVGKGTDQVTIVLHKHQTDDHINYQWLEPKLPDRSAVKEDFTKVGLFLANTAPFDCLFHRLNETLELGCIDCHGQGMYDEWGHGMHASGNKNKRFMSMYNGTDIDGNKSELTRHQYSRDYGSSPLPAREDSLYFGPGYRLDFPYSAGNCAVCHLPAAAIDDPYDTNPNHITGINNQGSHCDFCHKIEGIALDPESHLPYKNRPGVLSYSYLRPFDDKQLFFGPYDDVDAGVDVYLPLMKQSEFCAGCHDASFWDVPVYKSYSEWYQTSYREKGVTCQDCHMKPDGHTTNFASRRGGLERDPQSIATHRFEGALDPELLQNALSMHTRMSVNDAGLNIEVVVTNDKTGHHVPTDSPLRHLILFLKVKDKDSRDTRLLKGSTIPEWGGKGDPGDGNFAGLPGKIYAKVLEEIWTGQSPSGSYWMPTRIVSDNRIAAFHSDTSDFLFQLPDNYFSGDNPVQVDIQLIYRRAPKKLMLQKGWNTPDLTMNRVQATVSRENQPE